MLQVGAPIGGAVKCGTERWDVKTLSDPAVAQVDAAHPIATTVEQLRAMKVPGPLAPHTPRFAEETKVYVVQANLNAAKLEADSDFHVVISGASGATMIAEFADPACVKNEAVRSQISTARQAFVAKHGTPPSAGFAELGEAATLTGVLFFDKIHGQRGAAPNGVELHPVLSLR
jgi:hypothetical protein